MTASLAGGTRVATDGGFIRVADLVERADWRRIGAVIDRRAAAGDYLVREGTSGWRIGPPVLGTFTAPFADAGCRPDVPMLRVVSELGFELTCGAGQELLTTDGWVPARYLREGGHTVLIQSGPGQFPTDRALPLDPPTVVTGPSGRTRAYQFPTEWSGDLGYVLGWLTVGGWLRAGDRHAQARLNFPAGRADAIARIKGAINPWYGAAVREAPRPAGGFHLVYYGQTIAEFFEAFGLSGGPAEQRGVPDAIFEAPRDVVIEYLRGLFDAGSSVRRLPSAAWGTGVQLAHASKQLLAEVQLLLLNLGVRGRLQTARRGPRIVFSDGLAGGRGGREGRPLHQLELTGAGLTQLEALLGPIAESARGPAGFGSRARAYTGPSAVDEVAQIWPADPAPAYYLTEPATGSYLANGFVVRHAEP